MDPSQNNSFDNGAQGGAPIISSGDQGSSFGAMPVSSGVSNGTGDIILNGGGEKKSKKGVIVGVVVAVVLAVVGVGIWFLIQNLTGNGMTAIRNSFNEFANYFLYGTESAQDIEGTYQYGDSYWLADGGHTDEQIAEHFRTAEEKYQKFYKAYTEYTAKHANAVSAETKTKVDEYYNNLDLLNYLHKYPNLSANDILNAYSEVSDEIDGAITEYYGEFLKSTVQNTRDYADEYISNIYSLIGAFRTYENNGCFNNGVVARRCLQDTTNDLIIEANKQYNDFLAFYKTRAELDREISISVYQDIWLISRELQ